MSFTASCCYAAECEVENVPEYAIVYKYWIVTPDDHGRLWFWGAFKHRSIAEQAATAEGRGQIVVENPHALENRKRLKEKEENE